MTVPLAEVKRVQDHAFQLAARLAEVELCAHRTLRALDGYWAAYEGGSQFDTAWWSVFERWRARLEKATTKGST